MNSELIQWLGNVIVVLTAIGGLIKVIQVIFNLGQRLIVAPLLAQLATLSAQIDVLGKTLENLRITIITMGERVAKIEASAKSAHHRIDALEERVDTHIAQAAEGK